MASFIREVRDTLDEALLLKPGQGMEISFETFKLRERWRMTAYRAVQIDKQQSLKLFAPDHPAWDTSRWDTLDIEPVDKLTLRIKPYERRTRPKIVELAPLQPGVSRTI